ncbi:transposase [Leptothoe sp. PORK10 BA2]|uniref:transposase n=1 Tax=Leptothoe sp. PORK10 BA2 TaxID=3110254 RepID=UPI003FA3C8FB
MNSCPSRCRSSSRSQLTRDRECHFYWVDTGIKWRAMPHDLPNWSTVYDYYRRWVKLSLAGGIPLDIQTSSWVCWAARLAAIGSRL